MKRCLWLAAAALLLVAQSTDARKFPRSGHGTPTGCTITGITLDNNTFPSGSAPNTVVGGITVQTSGTCGTPSLTISDETNFSLSAATAPANLVTDAASTGGPWSFNIVATLAGANDSPKTLPVTITATAAPPPGDIITSFNIVNDTGGSVTTVLSPVLGLQFKAGDIPSGDWPQFIRHDNASACVYSQGLKRTWSDGSLKHLTVLVRCPGSIAATTTLQIDVLAGGVQPTTSARTTTELSNASILVEGTGHAAGNLSGTWTATLSDGIAGADVWLDGQAGKGWIVDADFKQSGSAHGQLRARFYTLLTTDGSGNLGGIRFLPRVWQPYYDVNTPAKNWRGFSSLVMKHGAGPTTINWQFPFTASTFTRTTSTTFSAPSSNYYWGSTGSAGGFGVVPVALSTTGTLPAGLSASQIYFAKENNNATSLALYAVSGPGSTAVSTTDAGTGTHTMTPILTCLHFGSIFGATAGAQWQYIQGGGSLATDPPLRTQREIVYWHSTRTIPPFDLSIANTVNDNAAWSFDWSPPSSATLGMALGTTGDRADIGVWNDYQVRTYYHQTAANEKLVKSMGLAAANIGFGFRDSATMAPPNVGGQAYTGFPASTPTFTWRNSGYTLPPTNNAAMGFSNTDFSHQPAMAFVPYQFYGTPEFLDLMIEIGDGAIYFDIGDASHRNPTSPAPGAIGITTGLPPQTRSGAWATRDLVGAAGMVPDTAPDGVDYKSYFVDRANASIAWLNTTITNTSSWHATNGFHAFRSFVANVSRVDNSVWQEGYLGTAVGLAGGLLESADAATFLGYKNTWYNHVMTTFGAYMLNAYYEVGVSNDAKTTPITSDAQWAGLSAISPYTWTAGTPGTITATPVRGAIRADGDKVIFTNGALNQAGTVPGGLSFNTPYYNVNCSGNTCNLAASPGGAALAFTSSGSGSGASTIASVMGGSSTGIMANFNANPISIYAVGNWGAALGVVGTSAPVNDALTRLLANGFNPNTDPKFYFQTSY